MLSYTDTDNGVTISVDYDRYVFDRWEYKWTVTVDGEKICKGGDLRSGCVERDNPERLAPMLSTLLHFLSAWVEALNSHNRESENVDLFPSELEEVAMMIGSDLFSMWANEVMADR